MSGRSGSRTAAHTPIVVFKNGNRFAISQAQRRIVRRAIDAGGACFVKGAEVRSAEKLVSIRVGTLNDDGAFGPTPGASNIDGERWTFTMNEGIAIE